MPVRRDAGTGDTAQGGRGEALSPQGQRCASPLMLSLCHSLTPRPAVHRSLMLDMSLAMSPVLSWALAEPFRNPVSASILPTAVSKLSGCLLQGARPRVTQCSPSSPRSAQPPAQSSAAPLLPRPPLSIRSAWLPESPFRLLSIIAAGSPWGRKPKAGPPPPPPPWRTLLRRNWRGQLSLHSRVETSAHRRPRWLPVPVSQLPPPPPLGLHFPCSIKSSSQHTASAPLSLQHPILQTRKPVQRSKVT